mmetsp:Transcript_100246/g.169319  ORF Transcript_100246/g.169319 Transcript_100246/m.169319 type:complete len:172 (-) Transcript_100246:86-601(-)
MVTNSTKEEVPHAACGVHSLCRGLAYLPDSKAHKNYPSGVLCQNGWMWKKMKSTCNYFMSHILLLHMSIAPACPPNCTAKFHQTILGSPGDQKNLIWGPTEQPETPIAGPTILSNSALACSKGADSLHGGLTRVRDETIVVNLQRLEHGGRRQPMCDPEGCATVLGAVGGT